jgi:glycosyltransferase involved in cell wall biosynthesis
LLERCIPSVREQTYLPAEHIVISDGPDLELAELLAEQAPEVTFLQLAKHLDGEIDYGSRARNHGLHYAHGHVVAYLDDDNAWRQDHLWATVGALEMSEADFAYSQMFRHTLGDVVGANPPVYGGIDTSLIVHRYGVPERFGMWPLPEEIEGDKHAPDWTVVARWLAGGATWIHVPHVTVDYY